VFAKSFGPVGGVQTGSTLQINYIPDNDDYLPDCDDVPIIPSDCGECLPSTSHLLLQPAHCSLLTSCPVELMWHVNCQVNIATRRSLTSPRALSACAPTPRINARALACAPRMTILTSSTRAPTLRSRTAPPAYRMLFRVCTWCIVDAVLDVMPAADSMWSCCCDGARRQLPQVSGCERRSVNQVQFGQWQYWIPHFKRGTG